MRWEGVDLLAVAVEDFDRASECAAAEWLARGFVTPSTEIRFGRAWRWLCARCVSDPRDDDELPDRLRLLRRLLRGSRVHV